jgi:hypothetical protein
MPRRALPILFAVLLGACSDESRVEALLVEQGPAIEAKLARLESLAPLVRDAPHLTRDGFDPLDPAPDFSESGEVRPGIATVLSLDDLAKMPDDPNEREGLWLRLPVPDVVRAAVLVKPGAPRGPVLRWSPEILEPLLTELAQLRYVLVVRTLEHREPVVGLGGYVRGFVRGEALLLDVEAGALRGGFRFQAVSREKTTTTEDLRRALAGDLSWSMKSAVRAGVHRLLPGTVLP